MKYYINPETEKGINQLHELVKPLDYLRYRRILDSWEEQLDALIAVMGHICIVSGDLARQTDRTAEVTRRFNDAWNEAV